MKNHFLLCPYDGFKVRIYSQSYIDFIFLTPSKYSLAGVSSLSTGNLVGSIKGEYEGFSIKVQPHGKRKHVEIAGSFHKFFYKGENYKPFYWELFLAVFDQFKDLFALDASVVEVVNLEIGINVDTRSSWFATAKDICSNILYFNPPSKRSARDIKEYKNYGFSWCAMHEQFWLKIYDKLPKFSKKLKDILRLEKKHKKSGPLKKLGVINLQSLLDQQVLLNLNNDLIKSLEKLIIFQKELDYCKGLPDDVKTFLLHYRKAEAWASLYLADKTMFKTVKKEYHTVLKKHCSFNLKEVLLNEAKELLFEMEQ